jgi:hypothetical protein
MSIDKQYYGDLQGSGKGEMLSGGWLRCHRAGQRDAPWAQHPYDFEYENP